MLDRAQNSSKVGFETWPYANIAAAMISQALMFCASLAQQRVTVWPGCTLPS